MKCNQWTLGLAAVGLVTLATVARADEKATNSFIATALSSTTLSGFVDTSAQWNLGTGNKGAPNYAFGGAGKADGFNLNDAKLMISKPADSADAWGAGYQFDMMFGPDASTYNTSSAGKSQDFAIRQAYVDLKAPVGTGLDIKMGVFDTIIGYEVGDSANNPNYTRSWGYTIEPTTHTGVLFGYTPVDFLSLQAGIADTYGPAINARVPEPKYAESYKTYMASAQLTAPTNMDWLSGSTVYACVINGYNGASPSAGGVAGGAAAQTSYYLGSTINTPWSALKVGGSIDYAANKASLSNSGGGTTGWAEAFDLYATYQATEKLAFDGRLEYADFGVKTLGAPQVFTPTMDVQYDLWKNVLSRVEFRYDRALSDVTYAGTAKVANPNFGSGFGANGTMRNSFEIIWNVVYKF